MGLACEGNFQHRLLRAKKNCWTAYDCFNKPWYLAPLVPGTLGEPTGTVWVRRMKQTVLPGSFSRRVCCVTCRSLIFGYIFSRGLWLCTGLANTYEIAKHVLESQYCRGSWSPTFNYRHLWLRTAVHSVSYMLQRCLSELRAARHWQSNRGTASKYER